MNDAVVTYQGQQVSVPKEVADFLEQDRRREQAEAKRDKRHLSKGDLETVLSPKSYCLYSLDDLAIQLRYGEGLSLEKIGAIRGVSKMAISKQLKKVHKELRSSVW